MILFDVGTSITDASIILRDKKACVEGYKWCQQFKTWGEVAQHADPKIDPTYQESWTTWYLDNFWDVSSDKIVIDFLNGLTDPMYALQMAAKFKTKPDILEVLEPKYKGKLPKAEKELAEGKP
jgi:hypothetical protein